MLRLCSIHRLTAAWCRIIPKEYSHLMCVKKPCYVHLVGLYFPTKSAAATMPRVTLWPLNRSYGGLDGARTQFRPGATWISPWLLYGWEGCLCSSGYCVSWWSRHYLCRPRARRSSTQTAGLYWWRGDRWWRKNWPENTALLTMARYIHSSWTA